MTRDILYDIAFKYKKTKLWKTLWDSQLFAICLSSGEIGYICVMGKAGEYCAISLYIGEDGFASYRLLQNIEYSRSGFMNHEMMLQQNCLQLALDNKDALMPEEIEEVRAYAKNNGIRLAGKNAYPQFIKYMPGYHPWKVTDTEDIQALYEAAEVCVLLSVSDEVTVIPPVNNNSTQVPLFGALDGTVQFLGMTDLPEDKKKEYPILSVTNEFTVAQAKRLKKKGIWEAVFVRTLEPYQNNPEEAPYYPLLLLIVDNKSGYLHPTPIADNDADWLQEYIQSWQEENTYPKEIRCRDERTYAYLKDISEKTGVKISIYDKPMPALEETEDELYQRMSSADDEDPAEMFMALLEMTKEEFRSLPQEILETIKAMLEYDVLPPDIARELRKKF